MCLLFTFPKNTKSLSDEWLKDFYTRNRDGFGVMYSEGNTLWVAKGIGTEQDWIEFFRKYEAKNIDLVFHLRMKTHGNIDLENTHPYEVFGAGTVMPVYMMHNGVLSHGNDKDKTKSDTWHYIRDYVRPLTKTDPAIIFTPEFNDVIGKHIGSNRFAFMNHLGETAIINRAQGVEWNGMWLSNTYAWSHQKAFPSEYKATKYGGYGGYSGYSGGFADFGKGKDAFAAERAKAAKQPKKSKRSEPAGTRGIPKSAITLANYRKDDLEADVIAATDDILDRSREVYEKTTRAQVERLFKEFGAHDAWRYIEAFSYSMGKESEEKFLDGLKDPRRVRDWLNSMDRNYSQMDYLL